MVHESRSNRDSACEKHTYDSGVYNVVLAGAAFMDHQMVFDLYFSDHNKKGREIVDEVFNCDDLLLNYIMAEKLKSAQHAQYVRPTMRLDEGKHAQYVRPTMRLDEGKLTSQQLSKAGSNFGSVRHKCVVDFAGMFGNPLLNKSYPLNWDGLGPPWCGPAWLGCVFI
eukprot:gene9627-7541_t